MNQIIQSKTELHQILAGATVHDAVSDHAFLIQQWLREWGFKSEIYASTRDESVINRVLSISQFKPKNAEASVIYHHSIGSDIVDDLKRWQAKTILVYHNITPPDFFTRNDPDLAIFTQRGINQLKELPAITTKALPVSEYNRLELMPYGFKDMVVFPLPFKPHAFNLSESQPIMDKMVNEKGDRPLLLFVGRLAPNKRQEDLIKLLHAYHQINPKAQLALIGRPIFPNYANWLKNLLSLYELEGSVLMPGLVSQAELAAYYQTADLYVSMSEHEGVGKPFLESMFFGLPILAYSASGTPYTIQNAGVLFSEKRFAELAELVELMISDQPFRERQIARQKKRLDDFMEENVKRQFKKILQELGLLTR
ncbi:MAG: glycosyltransferase family 4 protein [Ardenticatenaceae bacterium]|nr:glycosyltransferase family 4 protein [Ardenticatenaceae bacterium]